MKEVILTTDGACIGNPGPGGWACVLRFKSHVKEICGSDPNTTNNRMELKAVIEGLSALKESCLVTVYTDSEYLRKGITTWISQWKKNDWRRSGSASAHKADVKNRDLWMEVDRLAQKHEMRWEWVKGHAHHEDNNRCDFLANQAAREQNVG